MNDFGFSSDQTTENRILENSEKISNYLSEDTQQSMLSIITKALPDYSEFLNNSQNLKEVLNVRPSDVISQLEELGYVVFGNYRIQLNPGTRLTRYSDGSTSVDNLKGTGFPNPTKRFSYIEDIDYQKLILENSDNVKKVKSDPWEWKFTSALRDYIKESRYEYRRRYEYLRSFARPMMSKQDQIMLPVFPGNKIDSDWLLASSPLYTKVVNEVNEAWKKNSKIDSSQMLSFWNLKTPYYTFIRRDDRYKSKHLLKPAAIKIIQDFLETLFVDGYEYMLCHFEEFIPSIKGNKSVGPNAYWANGERFTRGSDGFYIPKEWEVDRDFFYVTNSIAFRLEVLQGAKFYENLEWFLNHVKDIYSNVKVFLEAFERGCINICFDLERLNNTDPVKDDYTTKSRRFSFEIDDLGEFAEGDTNSLKINEILFAAFVRHCKRRGINLSLDDRKAAVIKSRIAKNFNQSTWGIIWIFFAKIWFQRLEHSVSGLPSEKEESRVLYDQLYQDERYILWLAFDSVNSETWITTFFDHILEVMPEGPFRDLIKSLCVCVQPSTFGFYTVLGLLSGFWGTTIITMIAGLIRFVITMSNLLYGDPDNEFFQQKIAKEWTSKLLENANIRPNRKFSEIADFDVSEFISKYRNITKFQDIKIKTEEITPTEYVFAVFDDTLFGRVKMPPKLGTDDQLHCMAFETERQKSACLRRYNQIAADLKDDNLTSECGDEVSPVFGLKTSPILPPVFDPETSKAKWATGANEPDKTKLGDFLILKFFMHYIMCSEEERSALRAIYLRNGLGDPNLCVIYYIIAQLDHIKLRHTVDPIFDPYSSTSRSGKSDVTFSRDLSEDLAFGEQKYPPNLFSKIVPYLHGFFCLHYANKPQLTNSKD